MLGFDAAELNPTYMFRLHRPAQWIRAARIPPRLMPHFGLREPDARDGIYSTLLAIQYSTPSQIATIAAAPA